MIIALAVEFPKFEARARAERHHDFAFDGLIEIRPALCRMALSAHRDRRGGGPCIDDHRASFGKVTGKDLGGLSCGYARIRFRFGDGTKGQRHPRYG
jgi:hypothetical protein